jgi:hypothetical protein
MSTLTNDEEQVYTIVVKHKTLGIFNSNPFKMKTDQVLEFINKVNDTGSNLYLRGENDTIVIFRPAVLNESVIFLKKIDVDN